MNILVFKTNVKFKKNISTLSGPLNELEGIIKWNFDLSDGDKILRVVTNTVQPAAVEITLNKEGFYCRELKE